MLAPVRGPPMTPVRGPSSPLFGVLPDPCSGSFCHPCAGCLALTDHAVNLGFSESGALLMDLHDLKLGQRCSSYPRPEDDSQCRACRWRIAAMWELGVEGFGTE